jgi:diacylglycerol kinase family enzyme
MRLLFVINSKAGPGQKDWKQLIENWLEMHPGHTTDLYQLEAGADNCQKYLAARFDQYKPERVVAIGGDGTIKLVAGLLAGTNIPMGIIPGGSANGMAAELEIPTDEKAALELAVTGKPVSLDLLKINGEWCIHLSDIGLNASLLRHFEQIPQRGMLGYARAMVRLIRDRNHTPRVKLAITANNQVLQRKAVMAVIANATRYGTGAVINPTGNTNDGQFELVIVRRLAFSELVKMLITRRPFNPFNIETISCRHLEIHAIPASPFQVDGEYRGQQSLVRAEIFPGILQVIDGRKNGKISDR